MPKAFCTIVYILQKLSLNNSKKSIVIIEVNDAIFTKKTIDVIKNNPKKMGKKVIANWEYK